MKSDRSSFDTVRIPIRRLAADGTAEDHALRQVAREDQTVSLADVDDFLRGSGVSFAKSALVRRLRAPLEAAARADAATNHALLDEAVALGAEARALLARACSEPESSEQHAAQAEQRLAAKAELLSQLATRGIAPHLVQLYAQQLAAPADRVAAEGVHAQLREAVANVDPVAHGASAAERERAALIYGEATGLGFVFANSAGQPITTSRALTAALLNADVVKVDGHTLSSLAELSAWRATAMPAELARRALVTSQKKSDWLRILGASERTFVGSERRHLSFAEVIDRLSRGKEVSIQGDGLGRSVSSLEELEIWAEEQRNPFVVQRMLERSLTPERLAGAKRKLGELVAAGWTLTPSDSARCLRALFSGTAVRLEGVRVDRSWFPGGDVWDGAWKYYSPPGWKEESRVVDSFELHSLEALEALVVRPPRA